MCVICTRNFTEDGETGVEETRGRIVGDEAVVGRGPVPRSCRVL